MIGGGDMERSDGVETEMAVWVKGGRGQPDAFPGEWGQLVVSQAMRIDVLGQCVVNEVGRDGENVVDCLDSPTGLMRR